MKHALILLCQFLNGVWSVKLRNQYILAYSEYGHKRFFMIGAYSIAQKLRRKQSALRIMMTNKKFYDKLEKMNSYLYRSEAGYGSIGQYKKTGKSFRF